MISGGLRQQEKQEYITWLERLIIIMCAPDLAQIFFSGVSCMMLKNALRKSTSRTQEIIYSIRLHLKEIKT